MSEPLSLDARTCFIYLCRCAIQILVDIESKPQDVGELDAFAYSIPEAGVNILELTSYIYRIERGFPNRARNTTSQC